MLAFAHSALTHVLPFLFVLTLVVVVHEMGHFLAARACGVAVERFSIGFGRALLSWRDRSGVEWRVGWIPLGGYVKFAGDENAASVPDPEDLELLRQDILTHEGPAALKRYFHFKPLWQRAIVVAAGPVANFVLSVVLFASLAFAFGAITLPARVAGISPHSAAEAAGFHEGDLIVRAAGQRIESFFDLQQIIQVRAGAPIKFQVNRQGQLIDLVATPRRQQRPDGMGGSETVGVVGIAPTRDRSQITIKHFGPVAAVREGVVQTWRVLDTTVFYLGRLIRGQESADQLGGPLRIAEASHAVAKMGAQGAHSSQDYIVGSITALLGLAAVISVSIGFMNLLPVPVLDGGHLVFYAYEAIARRPVAPAVQAVSYRVGLALLLGLMLFATTNDLQRSSVFHFLGGLFS
ncbi:MAG: M50 family metallopeptidase [Caulobacteraceae bacterium]|nr:M50 family metallopeptidase [Caulobacteraceae bacterium]